MDLDPRPVLGLQRLEKTIHRLVLSVDPKGPLYGFPDLLEALGPRLTAPQYLEDGESPRHRDRTVQRVGVRFEGHLRQSSQSGILALRQAHLSPALARLPPDAVLPGQIPHIRTPCNPGQKPIGLFLRLHHDLLQPYHGPRAVLLRMCLVERSEVLLRHGDPIRRFEAIELVRDQLISPAADLGPDALVPVVALPSRLGGEDPFDGQVLRERPYGRGVRRYGSLIPGLLEGPSVFSCRQPSSVPGDESCLRISGRSGFRHQPFGRFCIVRHVVSLFERGHVLGDPLGPLLPAKHLLYVGLPRLEVHDTSVRGLEDVEPVRRLHRPGIELSDLKGEDLLLQFGKKNAFGEKAHIAAPPGTGAVKGPLYGQLLERRAVPQFFEHLTGLLFARAEDVAGADLLVKLPLVEVQLHLLLGQVDLAHRVAVVQHSDRETSLQTIQFADDVRRAIEPSREPLDEEHLFGYDGVQQPLLRREIDLTCLAVRAVEELVGHAIVFPHRNPRVPHLRDQMVLDPFARESEA